MSLILKVIPVVWLVLAGVGCRPQVPIGTSQDQLVQRLGQRLGATHTFGDAREVLLKERARGEEGRARLLLEALFLSDDAGFRSDMLNRFADVARPERVPYVDQELGLEPAPPTLYSSAAPQALGRVGEALAGQGLIPPLVEQAAAYAEAGEFIEAAGVMSLVQEVLRREPGTRPGPVEDAWADLARRRRCVARYLDEVRPERRLLVRDLDPASPAAPEALVEKDLTADPATLPCAVLAIQMISARPEKRPSADWAVNLLLSHLLSQSPYDSVAALGVEGIAGHPPPHPLVQPPRSSAALFLGNPREARRLLVQGIGRFLGTHPREVRRLLPLLSRGPEGPLLMERRDEVALTLLFYAPPQPEAAARIVWAYRHHWPLVFTDPLRYVEYLAQLGPDQAAPLCEALRDPRAEVLAAVAGALSTYQIDVVDGALWKTPPGPGKEMLFPSQARSESEREGLLTQKRILALRTLFRLPPGQTTALEQEAARETALDLHRCCRGQRGSCDRLSVEQVKACPLWTPLRFY